jgi:hypothetical protein
MGAQRKGCGRFAAALTQSFLLLARSRGGLCGRLDVDARLAAVWYAAVSAFVGLKSGLRTTGLNSPGRTVAFSVCHRRTMLQSARFLEKDMDTLDFKQHVEHMVQLASEARKPVVLVEHGQDRLNVCILDDWPGIGTILFAVFPARPQTAPQLSASSLNSPK